MNSVPDEVEGQGRSLLLHLRQSFLRGTAITLPILLTVLVFLFVVNFFGNLLDPAVLVLHRGLGFGEQLPDLAAEFVALVIILVVSLLVGVIAESDIGKGGLEARFEAAMASIPGFGSIYNSINELSELLIERETDSFREVKLVEYPTRGSYTIGFLTAASPEVVRTATGHEDMVTLFMPLAPNPFMGGFVIHVSRDRVHDVDMTVDEGVQAVVSSGVAVNEREVVGRDDDGDRHATDDAPME